MNDLLAVTGLTVATSVVGLTNNEVAGGQLAPYGVRTA
jgi:hypothetical protein